MTPTLPTRSPRPAEVSAAAEPTRWRQLVAAATRELAVAGVPSPRYDAEELAAHVLGIGRSGLLGTLASDRAVLVAPAARFAELVAQRADRVPLQHLTGSAGFRYLELAVGPGVFVPRPETELLAGWAVERAQTYAAPVVVDLCAGSGAIALSVANEVPSATVYAVELDPLAVAWAMRNRSAREAAGDRAITLLRADATDPATLAELDGGVDLVVTNPPYVPDDAVVAPEVARHDPRLAIFGGPDGLVVVRRLLARAAVLLRPGAVIGIEHADRQGELLPAAVRAHGGYLDVQDHADLNDRPRYTTATRR